ncbi:RidA family protein [Amycolatopsis ultiminotia]|uniref:RidA family protein n=1 Tax=Amycolatopsis ultiminotia TaxID=543629 RepID=A0ABP6V3M4_9PSEU
MSRKTFTVPTAQRPAAALSAAAGVGRFVAISGQTGSRNGETVVEGFEAQTRLALERLFAALTAAGASETDVVDVGVFLSRGDDFDEMNRIYREYFSEPYPARTTATVGLRPGVLFEVNAKAVLDDRPSDITG